MDPEELLEIQAEQERQRLEAINNKAMVRHGRGHSTHSRQLPAGCRAGDAGTWFQHRRRQYAALRCTRASCGGRAAARDR